MRSTTTATAPPPKAVASASPGSIFVSYAREDGNFVAFLVDMLRAHRLQPWHDLERVIPQRGKPRVQDRVQDRGQPRTERRSSGSGKVRCCRGRGRRMRC